MKLKLLAMAQQRIEKELRKRDNKRRSESVQLSQAAGSTMLVEPEGVGDYASNTVYQVRGEHTVNQFRSSYNLSSS